MRSHIAIFEIPAADLARAVTFYQAILDIDIEQIRMPEMQMGVFPYEDQVVTGVIIQAEGYQPSPEGVTIYLNAGEDLQRVLDRVEQNHGTILVPKSPHADDSGYFAISEAAAATAMYVLIVEVFIYKEIKHSQLPVIMRDSMVMVGGILLILGVSMASTNFLIDAEIPMLLFKTIQAHVSNKIVFLILLNLLLLVLGAILDIFSALVIMVPIILPVAINYGVDPVHLGIIFLANMQIGYFTPPVGMNLFIASYRFNKPVTELYQAAIPFMIVLFAAVLIITYWPDLSLVLLNR